MLKKLFITLAFLSVLVFVVNRRLHRNYLEDAEALVILSTYADRFEINMFTEFAPLPEHDRALITNHCIPVYQQHLLLVGTKDRLNPKNEPECQTFIRSGWKPGWTLDDGAAFLELAP